jgi:radical SAM protein with 4Fe4S-binding SPASM domain
MLAHIPRLTSAAGRIAMANVGRLATPLKVNFALTYWCQYRCKTCNIWKQQPSNELGTDEVLTFVARNRGVSWLDLTGGEIFLRKDVEELLTAMVTSWKSLFLLHFPTNGFLTDRIVSVCERLGARGGPQIIVTVSVDGDEALNDEVRGMKGGFRRQLETFRALRRVRGVRPVIGMTLSAHNVGAFERTFRACQQECPGLEIADFHLNVAQVSSHYYGNEATDAVLPDSDAAIRELRVYRTMKGFPRSAPEWIESTYLRHLESYLRTRETPMRCHSLRSSCFIDPWGTVFPCISYSRPLGRLRDHGMALEPIWNAASTRGVQREIWEGHCPNCWTACEAYQSILGNLMRSSPGPSSTAARRLAVLAPPRSRDGADPCV